MQTSVANRRANVGRVVSNAESVRVNLSEGELFAMSGDRRGARLQSLGGGLWVTQSGDPEDHSLQPGQAFVVSRKGKVVVTAMPRGVLRIS